MEKPDTEKAALSTAFPIDNTALELDKSFDCSARTEGSIELLRLRLEGVYEDIRDVLSTPNQDPGAESSRRLYFAATAIGRVVDYLSESESGEANAA
jgi:hypothetical protein